VLQSQGRLDEAIHHYGRALQANPDYAKAHNNLGSVLIMTGQLEGALKHFREAVRLEPDWPMPLNGAAWILATHPNPDVRDAGQAIVLAERAASLTKYQNASILNTLAASCASAGQFDRAVMTARAALGLASRTQDDKLANHIRMQLELYRQEKPYREPVRTQGTIHP